MNWQTQDYGISELCEATGLSARTVRYYEELGPPARACAAARAGGASTAPDELERLRFIQRLKALGLSLAEIKELNAVYAIGGSTRAMLARLDELLARHLARARRRGSPSSSALRDEIDTYRDHVGRAGRRARASARGGSA